MHCAALLGLAHLSGGETRVYILVGFAISFGWDSSSREIIYLRRCT